MKLYILLSILAFTATAVAQTPVPPTGLAYLPSSKTISAAVLNNPNVDGVIVGAAWADIEQSEGVFTFNTNRPGGNYDTFDGAVAMVEAKGKWIRIAIATGGTDPFGRPDKPQWLIDKITNDSYPAGKFFTYKDSATTSVTLPVFWEPTLLAKHAILIQAVADHLAATGPHPLVRVIQTQYANASSNDWNPGDISNTVDGITDAQGNTTPQTRLLQTLVGSPYATYQDALTDAGNKTFIAYHTAFPNIMITTSIGRITNSVLNPGFTNANNGRNIAETVVNTANASWPGHIMAQKNNLNGGGVAAAPGIINGVPSAWNDLYVLNVPHAAQMTWAAYGDSGCVGLPNSPYLGARMNAGKGSPCLGSTRLLKAAVDTGITYGTQWQEVYEKDILELATPNLDPDPGPVVDIAAYAHSVLAVAGPPPPIQLKIGGILDQ